MNSLARSPERSVAAVSSDGSCTAAREDVVTVAYALNGDGIPTQALSPEIRELPRPWIPATEILLSPKLSFKGLVHRARRRHCSQESSRGLAPSPFVNIEECVKMLHDVSIFLSSLPVRSIDSKQVAVGPRNRVNEHTEWLDRWVQKAGGSTLSV